MQCKSYFNTSGLKRNGFHKDFRSMDININFSSQFEWEVLFQYKSLSDMISIFYDIVYVKQSTFLLLKNFLYGFAQELKKIVNRNIYSQGVSRTMVNYLY